MLPRTRLKAAGCPFGPCRIASPTPTAVSYRLNGTPCGRGCRVYSSGILATLLFCTHLPHHFPPPPLSLTHDSGVTRLENLDVEDFRGKQPTNWGHCGLCSRPFQPSRIMSCRSSWDECGRWPASHSRLGLVTSRCPPHFFSRPPPPPPNISMSFRIGAGQSDTPLDSKSCACLNRRACGISQPQHELEVLKTCRDGWHLGPSSHQVSGRKWNGRRVHGLMNRKLP